LLSYHHALFGNPFTIPYRYEPYVDVHNQTRKYAEGFFGIGPPSLPALWLLLLSPAKGLFSLSPFLLVMPLASRASSRPEARPWLRLAPLAMVVHVLMIAMVN